LDAGVAKPAYPKPKYPTPERTPRGPAAYILSLAMLLPLAIVLFLATQLPVKILAQPGTSETRLSAHRPASIEQAPPPTLAPPTATPKPTPTPQSASSALVAKARTYVVQRGDQLKDIAARYGVSMRAIIQNNRIKDPDSLRVGQTLTIPDS
jgi:nucleoid-associated protein YgaU